MISLSIIIPSIRQDGLKALITSIQSETKDTEYEIIVVGPNKNYSSIHDYGHPCRCVQIGSIKAKGKYLTWLSDDGIIINGGLDKAVQLLESSNKKMELVYPYFEAINSSGSQQTQPKSYWLAYNHPTYHLPGIKSNYVVAPLGVLSTELFRDFGGFDCRFEHINLCCADLSFRLQNENISVEIPDFYGLNCNWSYMSDIENREPVQSAFFENDLGLLQSLYSNSERESHIDYNNWTYNSSSVWERRYDANRK